MPCDGLLGEVNNEVLVAFGQGCCEVQIPDGCRSEAQKLVRIREVDSFEEAEGDAFGATDIDGDQPVAPLLANAVHQHFVANVAFKVSAHIADSGIDFCDECSELVIHSRQESVPCGDVCFRADWHGGGFTMAGTPGSFMVESPNGYDY